MDTNQHQFNAKAQRCKGVHLSWRRVGEGFWACRLIRIREASSQDRNNELINRTLELHNVLHQRLQFGYRADGIRVKIGEAENWNLRGNGIDAKANCEAFALLVQEEKAMSRGAISERWRLVPLLDVMVFHNFRAKKACKRFLEWWAERHHISRVCRRCKAATNRHHAPSESVPPLHVKYILQVQILSEKSITL